MSAWYANALLAGENFALVVDLAQTQQAVQEEKCLLAAICRSTDFSTALFEFGPSGHGAVPMYLLLKLWLAWIAHRVSPASKVMRDVTAWPELYGAAFAAALFFFNSGLIHVQLPSNSRAG